jgi:hypothetical protein
MILSVAVLAVTFLIGAKSASTPVFEYKTIFGSNTNWDALNAEGKEGWELVCVTNADVPHNYNYFLKRQLR